MIYSELKFGIVAFVLFSFFVSNQVKGEQLTKQVQTIIKEDGLNAGKGFLLQKVYDGEIEVGSAAIHQGYDGYQVINVGGDDPSSETIDGYTPGNTITFKFWEI